MNTISEFYNQSELALAAYANLSTGISGKLYTDALENNDQGMSNMQALRFASEWSVVNQYTAPPLDSPQPYSSVTGSAI
jgi:hypothetical protein